MDKTLDTMTNQELGALFPIIIADHNPNWQGLFDKEASTIKQVLGKPNAMRVEHIGSTAVPHIKAKPTIDMLLEIPAETDKEFIRGKLHSIGYHYIPRPENPAPHMMFVKGYTTDGFKGQAYHIHVRFRGDWDEIYFRDYLRAHPDIGREYSELKMRLAQEYRNDRDGYTDKKGDFIKRVTRIARREKLK